MNLPPGGGGSGALSSRPSQPPAPHDQIRSSPQLLRQLTSPTVGGTSTPLPLPNTNNVMEYNSMLPRSPLPISQASYYTPSPLSPYGSHSPTYFQGGGLSPTAGRVPRPPLVSRTHRSPATSPARKRLKLDLNAVSGSPKALKRKLFEWRTARLRRKTSAYRDNMAELFFIKNGTNVTDNLPQFRRKPTQQFVNFLKSGDSPARVISEVQTAVLGQTIPTTPTPSPSSHIVRRPPVSYSPRVSQLCPVKIGPAQDVYTGRGGTARPGPSPGIPPPTAPVYTPDQVAERTKQEGWVVRRVAELTRDGLWPSKRMPQVAERPRPMSSWDLVLEEMKWMASDFRQERLWKKAAARVQSAACREHVIRRQEQEQARRLEQNSVDHKKEVARLIAGKIQQFWGEVETLYQYELVKSRTIHSNECLVQQTSFVSENPELNSTVFVPGVKRKLSELSCSVESFSLPGATSPEQEYENGVSSDAESTISEQEAWERRNCVSDCEISYLNADMDVPLAELLQARYPGFGEDWAARQSECSDECVSDWDSDSECEGEAAQEVNISCLVGHGERTQNSAGYDLSALSAKASSFLPKSVITYTTSGPTVVAPELGGVLKEHQQVALDWLAALHQHNLPAVLVDEAGLGRKVTISAFLSYLVLGGHSTGPHLIICPMSALASWESILATWVPALAVTVYCGNSLARRRLREEIVLSWDPPQVVLASYRALFLDGDWFLTRPWSLLVMAEIQNVISAGTGDQIRTLVNLKANRRVLLNSGAQKANPIDLWNTLYLMFPGVYTQRGDVEVEVEGTLEYSEIVQKLQGVLTGFSLSRTQAKSLGSSGSQETKLCVTLGTKKRKLYDDFLAQPTSQECLQRGALPSICGIIQSLREICNEPLTRDANAVSKSLPSWCILDHEPPRQFSNILGYDPLANISLDQVNLVFLSQELTTTVLTSARLRSIKASRKLIAELPLTPSGPPPVPRNKLQLSLEGMSRGVGGWTVGGLGEGVSLVRAANGQVYKVATSEPQSTGSSRLPNSSLSLGALHPESLETIAAINQWRCSGFPLYGQDLIKSLTITHSVRPVQSRYRGQGYVHCLNTEQDSMVEEVDRWKYSTMTLDRLCGVATSLVETLVASVPPRIRTIGDCKMMALYKLLGGELRRSKKVVVTTSFEHVLDSVQEVAIRCGVRYCVVRGKDSHTTRVSVVTRWKLEPRLCILVLVRVESQAGLDLHPAHSVVVLDSGPGVWEPRVEAPMYRVLVENTVEEGLMRIGTIRKILQDVDNSTMDTVTLTKQTLQDIFYPQPDNGYLWHNNTKKKKGITDTECVASLNTVWSYMTGGSGVSSLETLVDLAELETVGEMAMELGDIVDRESVMLRQWLEGIAPVRRYGMKLLKDCWEARTGLPKVGDVVLSQHQKKVDWERKLLMKELEEKEDTLANLVTYQSDLVSREWRSADGVTAPVYQPPGLCDDMVCEPVNCAYSKAILCESELPPVHVRDKKKVGGPSPGVGGTLGPVLSPPNLGTQLSPSIPGDVKPKIRREDLLASAPRSLFDRPKPLKAVPRRPTGAPGSSPFPPTVASPALAPTPAPTPLQTIKPIYREADAGPEWTIQEDWALHQAVTSVQELPLSLSATSPGHISNWDMVADMVNAVSRCFRSGKQCRARYESTVVPREEGRIMCDVTPTKKAKKAAKLGVKIDKKTGAVIPARQAMKTGALFKTDNNNAFSSMFSGRFETIKSIANKRTPTTTPLLVNPTTRNPKHAAVLAESGINYDNPLSPVQVAANRAERIQRDKARTAQLPTQPAPPTPTPAPQPSLPQSPVPQQPQAGLARAGTSVPTTTPAPTAQAVVVGISQPLQQVGQQAVLQNSVSGTATRPALQQTVTALSVQDILKNTVVTTVVSGTPGVLPGSGVMTTTARVPAGQIVMTQAGKTVTASSTVQVGNRQLTQQQLQALKQQTILKKNQQDQQIKQRLAMSSNAGGVASSSKVTMAGTIQGQSLGRGQRIMQNVRSMTEPEIKALLAKQPLKVGQGGVVTVPANAMSAAQLQQLGIQVGNPSTTATMVKTVTAPVMQLAGQAGTSKSVSIAGVPGVNLQAGQLKAVAGGRGTAIKGSPQQLQQLQVQRQLQLQLQKGGLQGQRVALSSGKGLPAQLIVQGGTQGKGLPTTVTVQQLQQIVKSGLGGGQGQVLGTVTGAGGQQIISHVVQAKPGQGQTVQARVIPVSGSGRPGQQTIQVVQAAPGQRAAPTVTMNQLQGRPTHTDLASALAAGSNVKIHAPTGASSQQILSQVSAALAGHGQNVSVAVRTPAMSNTPVLPPGATVVQQGGLSRLQGQQMVNLQLSVAGQAQPHTTHTISSSQSSNTE